MVDVTIGGPYISYAALCENVREEPSGNSSLIGMHCAVSSDAPHVPTLRRFDVLDAVVAVGVESGDAIGTYKLSITFSRPSPPNYENPLADKDVTLRGPGFRSEVSSPVRIALEDEGLYWFHVRLATQVLTRFSIHVRRSHHVPSV